MILGLQEKNVNQMRERNRKFIDLVREKHMEKIKRDVKGLSPEEVIRHLLNIVEDGMIELSQNPIPMKDHENGHRFQRPY